MKILKIISSNIFHGCFYAGIGLCKSYAHSLIANSALSILDYSFPKKNSNNSISVSVLNRWRTNIREGFEKIFPENSPQRSIVSISLPFFGPQAYLALRDDPPSYLFFRNEKITCLIFSIHVLVLSTLFHYIAYENQRNSIHRIYWIAISILRSFKKANNQTAT